jgi:FkbM family methyltransferase
MFNNLPTNSDDFYTTILAESINALKVNTFFDNFDRDRFNFDGKDHSREFKARERAVNFDWFFKNSGELFTAYDNFEDNYSKNLYLHLIAFRLAGHHSVKLPLEWKEEKLKYEEYLSFQGIITQSPLKTEGIFGALKHYDFKLNGQRFIVDCTGGLEYYLFRKQYFYSRGGVSIKPEIGDCVIDAGACMGDTALVFSNAVGPQGKVFAFDPVSEHLDILNYNIGNFPLKNVISVPCGLSNSDVACEPLMINGYNPGFRTNNNQVPLCLIDTFVVNNSITKIDFIKMDIEGSELDALMGGRVSINRFRPKLAISLYHKPNDIFDIIKYVKNNFPFYKIYIDHYTIHQEETVLYCSQ